MKLLITSATQLEIEPLLSFLGQKNAVFNRDYLLHCQYKEHEIDILLTGVGLLHTAFRLGNLLAKQQYDVALQMGIAGSFNIQLAIGDVVEVMSEQVADFGAEDDYEFIPITDMVFYNADEPPYQKGVLRNVSDVFHGKLPWLRRVRSVSVNKASGSRHSIWQITKHFRPDIENMEGAAFFYACLSHQLPFYQIRGISNHVEVREKDHWNIGLAVENVNKVITELIKKI